VAVVEEIVGRVWINNVNGGYMKTKATKIEERLDSLPETWGTGEFKAVMDMCARSSCKAAFMGHLVFEFSDGSYIVLECTDSSGVRYRSGFEDPDTEGVHGNA
jgi:hypothetical protein